MLACLRQLLSPALIVAAAWIFVAAPAAAQTTFTLNPSADAMVTTGPSNDLSGNNYGGAGALGVSGTGSAKGIFEAVMRFDLTAAKAQFDGLFGVNQWTVQSLSLRLTTSNPAGNTLFNSNVAGPITINWMNSDAWAEGTGTPMIPTTDGVTYDTLPGFTSAGQQLMSTIDFNSLTVGSTVTYSLNIPTGAMNDLLTGSSLSMHLFTTDSTTSYLFNSRSFGTASARPLLTVTAMAAVPEPATITLAGIALAGLLGKAGIRRRRDRSQETNQHAAARC